MNNEIAIFLYQHGAILFNGFSDIINAILSFCLWRAKEKYKHELRTKFIKTELRTTQLFNIYPEVFLLFKQLEGEIFKIRGPVKRKRQVSETDRDKDYCRKT